MFWCGLTGALCFVAGVVISNKRTAFKIRQCLTYHFVMKDYSDDVVRHELQIFALEWKQGKTHKLEEKKKDKSFSDTFRR